MQSGVGASRRHPLNFTAYHLALKPGPAEHTLAGRFYYHRFEKREETYWFGRREMISLRRCDARYTCTTRNDKNIARSFWSSSSYPNSFERWFN